MLLGLEDLPETDSRCRFDHHVAFQDLEEVSTVTREQADFVAGNDANSEAWTWWFTCH